MKKYCVTSTNFTGDVYYSYDSSGVLTGVEFVGIVEPAIHAKLCQQLPPTEAALMKWRELSQKMTITEVAPDLSFENFWIKYNYKVGKKEAETAWPRLSDAKKSKAIQQIPAYNKFLAVKGTPKAYPATYLNKERFEDEFK